MRFFSRSSRSPVLYVAPPTETNLASVASSDDLSALLGELNNVQIAHEAGALAALQIPSGEPLTSKSLQSQGKVHKSHILSNWIACQSFLSQAELDARARSSLHKPAESREGVASPCESSRPSAMTSRTSGSIVSRSDKSVQGRFSAVFTRSWSTPPGRRIRSRGRRSTNYSAQQVCQGLPYESIEIDASTILLIHDDSARVEEEWQKLETLWKASLHVPGPRTISKRATVRP